MSMNDNEFEEHSEDFGPCCACGCIGATVRNFCTLEKKAPVPGTGWGCMICKLPADGAIAVVCDLCMEDELLPKFVIYGYPENKKRCLIGILMEDFKHKDLPHDDLGIVTMPDYYDPHFQAPIHWRYEQSGVLGNAFYAYINYMRGDTSARPTSGQLSLVVKYLKYWINAPCWQQGDTEDWLDKLRARSCELNTEEDISEWLNDCLELGLAPI